MADASWWTGFKDRLWRILGLQPRASQESRSGNGHPVYRSFGNTPAGSDLKIVAHQKWQDSAKMPLDPALRCALVMIRFGAPKPVFRRTAILLSEGSCPQPTAVFLPTHSELTRR